MCSSGPQLVLKGGGEAEGRAVNTAVGPQERGDAQTGACWDETSEGNPSGWRSPSPIKKEIQPLVQHIWATFLELLTGPLFGRQVVLNRQPCMHLLWREDPGSSEIHAVTFEGTEG